MTAQPILLDISRLVWRSWGGALPTGIDRSMLAYVRHYRDRARAVVRRSGYSRILPVPLSRALFDTLLNERGQDRRRRSIALILTGSFYAPIATGTAGLPYLNVGHTGLDRPGHAGWLARLKVQPVYFVHDLIPITHPQYCRDGEDARHRLRIETLLRCGAGIIANSADTMSSLEAFAHRQGLPVPAHRLVAPLGVDPVWLEPRPTGMGDGGVPEDGNPYFLTLGTIEGRKNHILLLNVWRDMAAAMGRECPRLVIVGQRGWQCAEATRLLDECAELRGHVTELPACGDEALVALMANARALLFPSFAEGYGLPLVEAMAMGTPVVASDLPVFREIAGDLVSYLGPHDREGWREAIMAFADPLSLKRAERIAAINLAGYRPPDWSDHFALVDRWLADLATPVLPARAMMSTG